MKIITTHIRTGKTILDLASGNVEAFKSVNKAKTESRFIQLANGGAGAGAVKVNK